MISYIASIDVGTTNTKINLFNHKYQLIDTFKSGYQRLHITDDVFEMDLEEIWQIVMKGLMLLSNRYEMEELEIVLTTAMHSVQLMDANFRLSGGAITWADSRGKEILPLLAVNEKANIYQRTGTPMHSMNSFIKLMSIGPTDKLVGSIKDILFYRLAGEWALDLSNAASSGLLNLSTLDWDIELLDRLNIHKNQLPKIQPVNYQVDTFNESLGVPVKVVIGSSDGVSSNYIFNDLVHHAVLSIGTSHAIRIVSDLPSTNLNINNFSYAIDADHYLIGLASNNGADVLAWACDIFSTNFDELDEICKERPECQTIFLPYINGERAPLWDDFAMGHVLNITRNASRADILYAIILGMIFNIKENVDNLSSLVTFDKIGLVGGITQMTSLTQLIADILGYDLYVSQVENAETMGTIHLVHATISESRYKVIQPNAETSEGLNDMYNQYRAAIK